MEGSIQRAIPSPPRPPWPVLGSRLPKPLRLPFSPASSPPRAAWPRSCVLPGTPAAASHTGANGGFMFTDPGKQPRATFSEKQDVTLRGCRMTCNWKCTAWEKRAAGMLPPEEMSTFLLTANTASGEQGRSHGSRPEPEACQVCRERPQEPYRRRSHTLCGNRRKSPCSSVVVDRSQFYRQYIPLIAKNVRISQFPLGILSLCENYFVNSHPRTFPIDFCRELERGRLGVGEKH